MTSPRSLYIFTTSQNPLPGRYPRPAKPVLIVPPLIHRSLHQALDQTPPSLSVASGSESASAPAGITIPHLDHLRKHDLPPRSEKGPDETEITIKLHLVGPSTSEEKGQWVQEALKLVQNALGLVGADTLLIGFKGVDYKGKKTVDSTDINGNGDSIPPSDYSVSSEMEDHIVEFWRYLTQWLQEDETLGKRIKKLGTMYLPLGVLKRLKDLEVEMSGAGRVQVNSLDTPDCHHLPKEFTGWAKENGVQLWAGGGGEGSDPLPSAELHNILQEFASHLPSQSKQPLTQLVPLHTDGKWDDKAAKAVDIKWVLGYTLVSSSRNVVEDRGYVVAANLLI